MVTTVTVIITVSITSQDTITVIRITVWNCVNGQRNLIPHTIDGPMPMRPDTVVVCEWVGIYESLKIVVGDPIQVPRTRIVAPNQLIHGCMQITQASVVLDKQRHTSRRGENSAHETNAVLHILPLLASDCPALRSGQQELWIQEAVVMPESDGATKLVTS
jgi:hypothetical protein